VIDSVATPEERFIEGRLLRGDTIIGFNGQPVASNYALRAVKSSFREAPVELTVRRADGDTAHIRMRTDAAANLSVFLAPADRFLQFEKKQYGFLESLPAGVARGWSTLMMNIKNFKLLFTSKEVKASES